MRKGCVPTEQKNCGEQTKAYTHVTRGMQSIVGKVRVSVVKSGNAQSVTSCAKSQRSTTYTGVHARTNKNITFTLHLPIASIKKRVIHSKAEISPAYPITLTPTP